MRIPLQWLRDYVDFDVAPPTLAHDLTMLGTKIESVHVPEPAFTGVYVGKVLEKSKHPNADKLSLCRVDVGGEELRVVCGAANVRAGLTVAVARVGARLVGDVVIRKSKIRGETSEGMICSARELGLGADQSGILELDPALASGEVFTGTGAAAGWLEAEITPNRPDCLALLGVAREVAALYGRDVRLPPVWQAGGKVAPPPITVAVESDADCGRYLGRVLRGVRVGPSPAWLQERLQAMGLEPINNIVDVTNFVLFETGQPVHAFDLARLQGGRIVVRRGRAGETLRTLDGVERRLDPDILVIADGAGAVALAGIMGGAESAVQAATCDLLLEVACFRPEVVRTGRRKLGLDTDASYRFERQTDIEAVAWVADRATHLLQEVAGAQIVDATADAYAKAAPPPPLRLRAARASRLIGVPLDAARIATLLQRLHLPATAQGEHVDVLVPSFRRDLREEIDLVEEVARMHGYDNIPSDVVPPAPLEPRQNERAALLGRLRTLMIGLGYFEVRTSAFMDRRDPERLGLGADDARRQSVCLRNPLVTSLDTMRTTLLPGMLRVLRHNLNRDAGSLRLVAVDRVFLNLPGENDGLPRESDRLLALACGSGHPESWGEPARACDLFDLRGDAEALLEQLGVDSVWSRGYTEPFLDGHVTFCVSGSYGVIGGGGAVAPTVLRRFDVEVPVFALDLDIAALEAHLPARRAYRGIPRFPAVKRDLSLLVPASVHYDDVQRVVTEAGGVWLESVQCFDVFADRSLGAGVRSLGLRLRFRSPERTLLDDMVDPSMEEIVRSLAATLDVRLRVR